MLNRHFKHCHLLPIVLSVLLFGLPSQALAAQTVSVALPTFPITIGGIAIDNDHRQYPLLTYRNITYFPLTYHDTRFLGIESQWDDATQTLSIKRTDISGGYQSATQNNSKRYTATICTTPVMVNGKAVDHSKEPYPLLVFRDVTYFPMTWAYGVDEFGWQYAFDNKTGLTISSANGHPTAISLEKLEPWGYEPYNYNIRLIGNAFYYQGASGVIYQSALDNLKQPKSIFQLPLHSYGTDIYAIAPIEEQDGKMTFCFHQGGATMGHYESYIFAEDGSFQQDFLRVPPPQTAKGDGFLISNSAVLWSNQTELTLTDANGNIQPIGDQSIPYQGAPVIIGQKAFILGNHSEQTQLYVIDLSTNQTRFLDTFDILPEALFPTSPTVTGNFLYFIGGKMTNGAWTNYGLYQFATDIAEPQATDITFVTPLCADKPLYAFAGQTLFYGNSVDGEQKLYKLRQTEPINPHGHLVELSANEGYVIAVFADSDAQNDTRLLVFDQNGQTIFRSADVVQNVQIDHGRLFYLTPDGQGWLFPLR